MSDLLVSAHASDILVSVQWLADHGSDPNVVVLDSTVLLGDPRFPGDYRVESGRERWRQAHVPGARFADLLGEFSDHQAKYHFAMPAPRALAAALERLGVADGSAVVIYGAQGGFWAARLWWMLHSIGVRAAVLDGGLDEWRRQGFPLESGELEAAQRTGTITVRELPGAWTDQRGVAEISAGRSPGTLICALSPDAFYGRTPSRYVRPGHIPGSRNLPARGLFDSTGRYLGREGLTARVDSVLPDVQRPLVIYCGGGISAAADAFALTLLGEANVSIYDGSLEEWAADPALPLVTE